ncbi:MAG: tetratricopeptide repeat protein [Phycisphaerales bacterium]|nr:tetratricopeptide repeat protein [Phycisphaerales bacterium]
MNDWVDAEQHVERAHEHYDAGRWDEAVSELRRALSLNPYQAEWYFNLGLTLEAAGKNSDAATAFAQCFTLHEEHDQPDANSALLSGVNLVLASRPEAALAWFYKALKLEPMNITIFVHRIEALIDLDRHEEAEEVFYLGQQIDPEHGELYSAIAESLMKSDHTERAVWCLREAARLDPELPRVRARLASAYASAGRLERARQLYLQELRTDPGDLDTLLDLGELLMDMHRNAEAGEKFRRVLEIEPDQPDAHFLLGELAEQEHRIADALVHYDVVIRLDKEYPAVRQRLARVLQLRNREEDLPRIRDLLGREHRGLLVASAAETIESRRPAIEDLEEVAGLLLDADMTTEAIRVYRALIERRPSNHRAHHGLSVAMLEAGRVEEGIAAAKQALKYQPKFVPAMHNLALACLRQGQWIRARYWVRHALRIEPEDATLRRLRMKLRVHSSLIVVFWGARKLRSLYRSAYALVGRPTRRPA